MIETIVTVAAIIAAGLIFRAIWTHFAFQQPVKKDADGFEASAARWGYLHDGKDK
jgi:hypothetical protein